MADDKNLRIEIDPLNPAQFFACCGMLELLSAKATDVSAKFTLEENHLRRARFILTGSDGTALADTLAALKNAKAVSENGFNGGEAPVNLEITETSKLTLDWWLVPERNHKSRFKLWAGQQTTPALRNGSSKHATDSDTDYDAHQRFGEAQG